MTTTLPPAPPRPRVLRRTREGRVAAGVANGFGTYFGVDPVLFRVLFATSAFFGGAGILAYLLAWAAIPEEGTERAAVDGWVAALRRRRVPVWVVAVGGGLLLWAAAASWWAPGPPLAVIAVAGVAAAAWLGRRQARGTGSAPTGPLGTAPLEAVSLGAVSQETVSLEKHPTADAGPGSAEPTEPAGPDGAAGPVGTEVRAWLREAHQARRVRARRAQPVRIATLVTLVVVLTVLALVDAAHGVELQVYFWTTLGIAGLGLLVGVVLRRSPWSLVSLLVPAVVGAVAFGGSAARLHDGVGERTWTPVPATASAPAGTTTAHYRLAFGRADLDLRSLTGPARLQVTVGAGDVRIIAPRGMALTVDARVHLGQVTVDGQDGQDGDGGAGVHRVVRPPAGASGPRVTVHVQLADGRVLVDQL